MSEKLRIIVHCSASDFGTAIMIDQWHRAAPRNWSGIGYQTVIENGFPHSSFLTAGHNNKPKRIKLQNGAVSFGRILDADGTLEPDEYGAHAYGHNKNTLAICLIGNEHFTKQQVISLVKVIRLYDTWFKIDINETNVSQLVLGHCELPGVTKTCPNIDMNIVRELVVNKVATFNLFKSLANVKEVL